jgi:hypothetical protein
MLFSFGKLFLWTSGICFFGITFAALMRKRLVEKEDSRGLGRRLWHRCC